MLKHLDMLFGRALKGCVEITAIHTDKAAGHRPRTRFVEVDDLDTAADFAEGVNAQPGWNVYVGAAVRDDATFRGQAADDSDFFRAYAVWADADDGQQTERARTVYREQGISPPFVVVTGRQPSKRAQLWWPLDNPIEDINVLRATLRGIAAALGTDPKVCTGKQLMRLGGSVNWPKKDDRVLERTEVVIVQSAAWEFTLEQINRAFPPMERAEFSASVPDVEVALGGALGLEEKVMDGREGYAFNLVTAHLHEWIGTTGSAPSVDELYRSVAPVYLAKADQLRAGRGPEFLKQKCADRLRAYNDGLIPFMRTLDEAVLSYAERRTPADTATADQTATDAVDAAPKPAIQATPYQWVDPGKIPPRDVLYGRHLFRKFLSATVAPGGLGKSSLEIVEALAMVTGRQLLDEAPKGPLSVWYWNGEDPMEELQRRVAAACLNYQITPTDIAGRLYVDSGRDTEIVIVRDDRDGFSIAVPTVEAIIQTIKARDIDVLIIDPFVASHAVSENDNTKIEAVAKQWMRIADEGDCAVELVHHVRKPGGAGQETTVDDARGAGALLAKTRSARVLNAMTKAEADEIGVEGKGRYAFFRVDNGKANLMPRGGEARWRRMVGVPLGNRVDAAEDEIGVAVTWQKPDAFAGVNEHHLAAVRAAIEAGQWREDVRAANWAGVAIAGVLGLDPTDPQARGRLKSILRLWVKNGVLDVVQGFDSARKQKQFVVVGSEK